MTDSEQSEPQLWTLKEVADRLRICERSVHNLLYSGELEGMLLQRRWKFSEDAIQAYLKNQQRKQGEKGARKKRSYTRRTDKTS